MAQSINVPTPTGEYNIHIQSGILKSFEQLPDLLKSNRVVILTNDTVAPLHANQLCQLLPQSTVITMQDGEQYKNLDTVSQLYSKMIEAGADRNTVVVALGGGVVGDTAGFVASTYMRGIRLVQIPTSLLSMVDSSVGGKVGVDLIEGKNLVGAFKQPEIVIIDPDVLDTLPDIEWRNGMAEVIKHGFISDETLLDSALHEKNRREELISRAVQVKVDVVTEDPFEHGIRAHLNLGHTFGHAIEQVTNYAVPHGQGVGIGLVAAAKLSHLLGLCDQTLVDTVEHVVDTVGLPTRTTGLNPNDLYKAMSTDKKWKNGRSRFVLLRAIGEPLIMEDVAETDVIRILTELQ